MKRSMKHLLQLNPRQTAIEELPSSIENLSTLRTLNIGGCKNLRSLKLPSSLERVDAHDCRSMEDLSSLLWLCHLNWLKSATEELKCWKLSAVIPESSGIPEWIRYENLGSEVTTELPMNWYEDPDLLGFVVSCVHQPIPTSADYDSIHSGFLCILNLHGSGFGFEDQYRFTYWCECRDNFNDMIDRVWVCWYPKIAIPKEHQHKFTHFKASFTKQLNFIIMNNVKKCGVNLIFAGDHMPMLLDHLENCGDNGSVVLEESNGNRKRSRDNSLPHAEEEPQYKRLAAP